MKIKNSLKELINRSPKQELKNNFYRTEHNNFHKGSSIKGRAVCLLRVPAHFAGIVAKPIMYSALGTISLGTTLFYTAKGVLQTLRHENTAGTTKNRNRAFKAIFLHTGNVLVSSVGQVAQLIKAIAGILHSAAYFKKPENNGSNPLVAQPWWEKATEMRKAIGRIHLENPEDASSAIDNIKKEYYQAFPEIKAVEPNRLPDEVKNQPLGLVFHLTNNFGLWMRGVAITAAYMRDKKGLENLYVCENVAALEKKVREITNSNNDQRCGFVVCTNGGEGISPFYPQHKVAVCLEKKQDNISTAVIDPEPLAGYNDSVNVKNFSDQAIDYNSNELVLKHLSLALANDSCNKTLFFSKVLRETHGGCAAFALHDAKAFLRDDHFFDKIKTDVSVPNSDIEILPITLLPPEFMVGTQSQTRMNAYAAENPDLMRMPFYGKEKGRSLLDRNQENFVRTTLCFRDGYRVSIIQKDVNQYMAKKTIQNLDFIKTIALSHTKKEVDKIIAGVWVPDA